MIFTTHLPTPLGEITLASNGQALTGLWFSGQKYYGSTLNGPCEERALPVFDQTREWLELYFAGVRPDFPVPLSLNGSPFRLEVWEILRQIPYGETVTYGAIARQIAAKQGRSPFSAQAVGGAVGHNPISILIPCHRVIGSHASLTGYAGGIPKKIELLKLEGVDVSQLTVPKKEAR